MSSVSIVPDVVWRCSCRASTATQVHYREEALDDRVEPSIDLADHAPALVSDFSKNTSPVVAVSAKSVVYEASLDSPFNPSPLQDAAMTQTLGRPEAMGEIQGPLELLSRSGAAAMPGNGLW